MARTRGQRSVCARVWQPETPSGPETHQGPAAAGAWGSPGKRQCAGSAGPAEGAGATHAGSDP
eukprot:10658095-Alexandrium_andersonii.AAC.1